MTPVNKRVASASKRAASVGLLSGLLLSGIAVPTVAAAAPGDVEIADEALRACVQGQLGLQPDEVVTEAAMATMVTLICRNSTVSDIGPLVHATQLSYLDLFHNNVTDLTPLAGLTELHTLNLVSNGVEDVSALVRLTNMRDLYLNQNQVSDLTPLGQMTKLQGLMLHFNRVSDLSPLAGLPELRVIYVPGNAISDISPIAGLTRLQTFSGAYQELPAMAVETGVPVISPVLDRAGERVPLWVSAGDGSATGTEVIWNAEGQGIAEWEANFPLGNSIALFSGSIVMHASTTPEVALEGVPLNGKVGESYTFDFVLHGKPTIPMLSVVGGTLPAGLALSPDGRLSGTPTAAGSYSFEVLVSNGAAEQRYRFTVLITDVSQPKPDPDPDPNKPKPGVDTNPPQPGPSGAQLAKTGAADDQIRTSLLGGALLLIGATVFIARRRLAGVFAGRSAQ